MGILSSVFGSNKETNTRNTVIDKDIIIRGHINISKGGLHIQGVIDGNIVSNSDSVTRVVVGKSGIVQGNINASTVVVLGKVVGNIKCTNVEVLLGSVIEGDIQYQHMAIDGGRVTGKLSQTQLNPPTLVGNAPTSINKVA